MGLIQGATPASAAVSRTGPVDLTGALWAFTRRIKWADAGAIAGSQTFFGAGGLTIVWNGTNTWTVTVPGSTPGVTSFTVPAPSANTEYDLVICYNTLLAYGFWRATSAGSAGLSTSTTTPVSDVECVSPTSLAGATWYFGNTSALATGSEDTSRDSALFVGAVLSAADIELFGKGAAPFQLMSATLQMSPADIGGVPRDRVDGLMMTVHGTATVNTVANYDGPLAEMDTTRSSDETGSILARYGSVTATRECGWCRGSLDDINAAFDLSGGGAHAHAISQSVTSITRSGTTATVTYAANHGMAIGDNVTIEGCTGADGLLYNGTFPIVSAASATTLTYTMTGTPTGSAAGTITGLTHRPSYVLTDGRPSISFMNTVAGGRSSFKWLRFRADSGRSATAGITVAGVVGADAPTLNSGSGEICRLAVSAGTSFWIAVSPSGSAATSLTFGINNNNQGVPSTQSPRLLLASNRCSFICSNTGAGGANNHRAQVDDTAATTTQTNTNATRYMYSIGSGADNSNMSAWTCYELEVWSADKSSVATSLTNSIRNRNNLQAPPTKAVVVLGSSTDQGSVCTKGQSHVKRMRRVNAAGVRVFNFGRSGCEVSAQRFTGVTRSGAGSALAFTAGETVTCGASGGSGKFIAEDPPEAGGMVQVSTVSGTIDASGTLTGTGGATRTYTATTNAGTGNSMTDEWRISQIQGALSAYSTGTIVFLINSASNGNHAGATAALSYACDKELIRLLRAAFPSANCKFVLRMYHPRVSHPAGVAVAYRTLVRAGAGVDFDRHADISVREEFDDFSGSTDYGNLTYMHSDQTHPVNAGHGVIAEVEDPVVMFGLGFGGGGVATMPAILELLGLEDN
jgi:hypothetical protein